MKSIHQIQTSISAEINQKEILQKHFILKILSSKRLLVDHVEIMEEAVDDFLKNKKPVLNLFTFLKTSGVLATSFVIFVHLKQNYRYLIPSLTGIMPIIYMQKLVNSKKRELLESNLADFLKSLDYYETAIKKNLSFLHEAQHLKASLNILKRYDKDNKIPHDLIGSIKRTINILYNFVKDLEESYAINENFNLLYQPFEDIQECSLMTIDIEEVDNKTIKDFFNIFAYVQSQVLLRFGLIAASNVSDGVIIIKTKIGKITDMIRNETAKINKFMDIISNASQLQKNIQMQIDEEISTTIPNELRYIRTSSMKFSSKILALALQSQNLEDLITQYSEKFENLDNKEVENIIAVMKSIESELLLCNDEHQRISITFQKYLNMELEAEKIDQGKLDKIEDLLEKQNMKRITSDDVMVQSDDFFFVEGNEDSGDDEKTQQQDTIQEVNSKLAKKYFKPVLVQLKERIEVIGDEMKEREKKVLKAKGIEIQDEQPSLKISSEDESGSDDELERKRKFKRNEEKYSGNREFLESKQPINIFAGGLPLPSRNLVNEDVLE